MCPQSTPADPIAVWRLSMAARVCAWRSSPPTMPKPSSSAIWPAKCTSGATLVHFAGQIALDEGFGIVGGDDLHAQTRAAMLNLQTAMGSAGVDWGHIVRRTIYTTQPTQYEVI